MLAITRKNKIKEIIIQKKSVTVSELSKTFNVTEETIRRDLQLLEEEGFLKRIYGGAYIDESVQSDASVSLREKILVKDKEKIAKECKYRFIIIKFLKYRYSKICCKSLKGLNPSV